MNRLAAAAFAAVLFAALLVGPALAADAGDAIGGVNIGERKDEAIDDRLSCASGDVADPGAWAAFGLLSGVTVVRRSRRRAASTPP